MAEQTPLELDEVLVVGTRKGPNLHTVATSTNVLHYFRSHTALFTISCVPVSFLNSESYDLNNAIDNFVIAASGGKNRTTEKLEVNNNVVAGQNLDKGSRFITSEDGIYLDFFIDDVEVETLADFNQQTGFSKATKLRFNVTEPYSLSGFLQTLQAASVKAGYVSYMSAPFVFRINFIGHPDWDDNEGAWPIEPASRYFIFRFSEVTVSANETGTRYQCKAVPLNELGFGQGNKLLNNVTTKGNTVGEILDDFFVKINEISKYSIWTGATPTPDKYTIKFPTIEKTGAMNEGKTNEVITKSKVGNPDEDNVNFSYENPALIPAAPTKENLYNAKIIATTFNAGSNIHDCIAGIIRDSDYITQIFKQPLKSLVDEHGMIDYFNVICSVTQIGWSVQFNRPVYEYTYKVIPHKIHYSRIPKYSNQNISIKQVRKRVRRSYNYLYTGKNLDILRFDLNFNYLYFQAAAGNEGFSDAEQGSGAAKSSDTTKSGSPNIGNLSGPLSIAAAAGEAVPIAIDVGNLTLAAAGQNTRGGPEKNQPLALAKNFHRAILENLSQSLLEIEILGDPYYLSHQGMNNFISQFDNSGAYPGITASGDMNYQTGEIFVEITFRNPTDINPSTGMMDFSDEVTSYSGIYRIKTVTSRFVNGMFTQVLQLIKLQRQSPNLAEPSDPTGYDKVLDSSAYSNVMQGIADFEKSLTIPISKLVADMCTKYNLPKN